MIRFLQILNDYSSENIYYTIHTLEKLPYNNQYNHTLWDSLSWHSLVILLPIYYIHNPNFTQFINQPIYHSQSVNKSGDSFLANTQWLQFREHLLYYSQSVNESGDSYLANTQRSRFEENVSYTIETLQELRHNIRVSKTLGKGSSRAREIKTRGHCRGFGACRGQVSRRRTVPRGKTQEGIQKVGGQRPSKYLSLVINARRRRCANRVSFRRGSVIKGLLSRWLLSFLSSFFPFNRELPHGRPDKRFDAYLLSPWSARP